MSLFKTHVPAHPTDKIWIEYDWAADWVSFQGPNGPPPPCSPRCQAEIDYDPEAFTQRIKDHAYARAMNKLNLPEV